MFYSQFILAKKGPLGTIWIAAHLERKLRKNQVTETNIGVSVDSILFPEVPIALRLSGHLLLGVVRIYSRKVNYLFHDCSEALVKIKQAFHSGAVDLPPEAATAPIHAITLPENFDLDDLELLPDREALFLANSSIDHHVTSREQITLQDHTVDDSAYGSQFGLDDRLDAPRLEFDEDVIPVKSRDEEEDNARAEEEDTLPMADDDHQLDDDKLEVPVPETADVQMQDLPDLNEEHPPEVEAAGAMELESTDASNALGETPVVPDMVSSEETCEKQAAGMTAPEEEQRSEESPAVEHEELPLENQATTEHKEASTGGGEALPDTNDQTAEEIRVAEIDKPNGDKETLETEKTNENGAVEEAEEVMQDVPEIEKVRSSADVPDMEPTALPGLLDSALQEDEAKAKEVEETPALKQDGQPDVEETPILKQDAPSELRTSPGVSEFGGDDDMLASILGRRSLKVASTPDLPPAKRQKPGPKPVVSKKRKVQLDDATVLHGDDMRQQLSDTISIRRVRKRAPCNEYEIWSAEREVQGQQMFEEPVVLGFCDNVRELYRSLWDAKRAAEPETSSLTAKQKHQLEYEETEEAITLAEEQLDDDYVFYDMQHRYPFEVLNSEEERHSTAAPATSALEQQVLEEATHPGRETDVPDEDSKEKSLAKSPAAEVDVPAVVEEEVDNRASEQPPALLEGDAPQDVAPLASAEAPLNNGEDLEDEHGLNEQSRIATPPVEPEGADTSMDAETGSHAEKTVPNDDGTPLPEQNILEQVKVAATDVENVQLEEQAQEESKHGDGDGHGAAEGLGFLTDAKDEEVDDGENGDSEYVEPEIQDSSGWSVRTRAVCQYLRMTFEHMESSRKVKEVPVKIGLERLLQGKTRRESARMFFESLVLKTKDYINVEQDGPFDNIYITARSKLMKAEI